MHAPATPSNPHLFIGDASIASTETYDGRHALLPVLLGLSLPLLAVILFDASDAGTARKISVIMLGLVFIVASIVSVVSIVYPGPVVAVTLDPTTQHAEIVWAGPFASRRVNLPFRQIAGAEMDIHYDDDGYSWCEPVLILDTGDVIALPQRTSTADINALNTALGRY